MHSHEHFACIKIVKCNNNINEKYKKETIISTVCQIQINVWSGPILEFRSK
jgi:hypothetical protein